MSLSSPAKEPQPEIRLFEMDDFSPPEGEAPAEPDLGKIEQFHLLFVGNKQQDPRLEAKRIAEKMREQASQELNQAQSQAEQLREQAKSEGYQKGYEEGLKQGVQASQARINAGLDNLARTVDSLEKAKSLIMANMEAEILALLEAVLDRYFCKSQALPTHLLRSVIFQAISRVNEAEKIAVKVSSRDLDFVSEFKADLARGLVENDQLIISPDAEMEAGGCVVETPILQVDASVATRRKRLFKVLEDAFHLGQPLDLSGLLDENSPNEESVPEPETDWEAEPDCEKET